MNWHEFVFSEKKKPLIARHLAFWLFWWLYLAATYYYYLQAGLQKIAFGDLGILLAVKTFLLICVLAVTCYFFIYVLLPRYVFGRKYVLLGAGIVLLTVFLLWAGYLLHAIVFPIVDARYHYTISAGNSTLWWTNINSGLLNAPKLIAAATAIKLVKRWYFKQKEKERIEKEKLVTDLQLMKAQIRPGFLFSSLDQIYEAAKKNSPEAPELLIKLADLLSYLLYECDEIKVPLEKELKMMREYMLLEKARYGGRLDLEIAIRGDMSGKQIAPLLLLPFIEDSFRHGTNQDEQAWTNLDIIIENETLSMKLLSGMVSTGINDDTITAQELNIEKRLQLLYAGNYELKRYVENEIDVVVLKLNLAEKSQCGLQMIENGNEQKILNDYALN
jgi:sensor histidine kinase YesM